MPRKYSCRPFCFPYSAFLSSPLKIYMGGGEGKLPTVYPYSASMAFACDLAFSYIFKLVSGITPWTACTCRSAHLTHLHRKRREGGTVLFWKMQWRQCLNIWNTVIYSKTCRRFYIQVSTSRVSWIAIIYLFLELCLAIIHFIFYLQLFPYSYLWTPWAACTCRSAHLTLNFRLSHPT